MSGSGRKSQYRKSVTGEYLNGFPLPESRDVIALVKSSRGTNIFEVETGSGVTELAMMPTKFKKLIWIKRGDFVILSASDLPSVTEVSVRNSSGAPSSIGSAAVDTFKVNYMIKHILTKPQIRHIQQNGLWDERFELAGIEEPTQVVSNDGYGQDFIISDEEEGDEYEESEGDLMVDKMGNTIHK